MPTWTGEAILELSRGYMGPLVLGAAARLNIWTVLGRQAKSAEQLAGEIGCDRRALTALLDALAAMGLLAKSGQGYVSPPEVFDLLSQDGPHSIYHAVHHIAVIQPRWAVLDEVVKTGVPYTLREGYEPPAGALTSFIEAMHVFSRPEADKVVAQVDLGDATRLLDVGGGPGTWTLAFLNANPNLRAVLFDRPEVIPIARRHVEAEGMAERVTLSPGDFYTDELPDGCDAAWVSAIIHMNSRQQNRELFAKVNRVLSAGGQIIIRDHVMDESHTRPVSGAMFALNMLVSTAGGGTFTFAEIAEDLAAAGFGRCELLEGQAEMNCLVRARKP